MRTHPDLEIDSSFVRRSFSDTFVFYVESPVTKSFGWDGQTGNNVSHFSLNLKLFLRETQLYLRRIIFVVDHTRFRVNSSSARPFISQSPLADS